MCVHVFCPFTLVIGAASKKTKLSHIHGKPPQFQPINESKFCVCYCSGTLSYIFNNFSGKKPFSEVVAGAKEAGYTEPDPRDDLSGTDVARKVPNLYLIL